MRVSDVMSSPLVSVGAAATFKEIVEVLLEHDIGAVPVLDDEQGPIGVVAEADVLSRVAFGSSHHRPLQLFAAYFRGEDPQWLRKSSGLTAREVMTAPARTARTAWSIRQAARSMLDDRLRRLVVDDDGRAVGLVSRQDLLRQFEGSDTDITDAVRHVLGDVRYVPEDANVAFTVSDGVVDLTGDVRHPSGCAVVSHAVGDARGVVAVECHLTAREPEPSLR